MKRSILLLVVLLGGCASTRPPDPGAMMQFGLLLQQYADRVAGPGIQPVYPSMQTTTCRQNPFTGNVTCQTY